MKSLLLLTLRANENNEKRFKGDNNKIISGNLWTEIIFWKKLPYFAIFSSILNNCPLSGLFWSIFKYFFLYERKVRETEGDKKQNNWTQGKNWWNIISYCGKHFYWNFLFGFCVFSFLLFPSISCPSLEKLELSIELLKYSK